MSYVTSSFPWQNIPSGAWLVSRHDTKNPTVQTQPNIFHFQCFTFGSCQGKKCKSMQNPSLCSLLWSGLVPSGEISIQVYNMLYSFQGSVGREIPWHKKGDSPDPTQKCTNGTHLLFRSRRGNMGYANLGPVVFLLRSYRYVCKQVLSLFSQFCLETKPCMRKKVLSCFVRLCCRKKVAMEFPRMLLSILGLVSFQNH